MRAQSLVILLLVALGGHPGFTDDPVSNPTPATVTFTNQNNAAAQSNQTEITSKQLRMDTEQKVAYFDGDVLVVDPRFQLRSNRLIVFLNQVGSGMDHAEAYDDVIIVQEAEKRKAYAQKAVYTASDGKIVLSGNPRLENDKGTTRGEIITIFRGNNKILIEGGTKTLLNLSLPEPTQTNAPPADPGDVPSTTNEPPTPVAN